MNKNLITRILTGLVAGSVSITALVISPYGVWIFCALISMLGLWEMMKTSGVESSFLKVTAMIMAGIPWVVNVWLLANPNSGSVKMNTYVTIGLLILPVSALVALYLKDIKEPIRQLSVIVLAFVYVYLPFQLFYEISVPESASDFLWQYPLGIMLLIWTLDSMAYFVGRFLGKNLLFPRISPKKTWEGSLGGAAFCLALGYGFTIWMDDVSWNWMIVAGLIAVLGQLGDLVESMFKRSLNLKDSGNILPGHGGILDRFDGFFLVLPFVFLYYFLF
ncbi:MAG: phosphatidate cytidylyltransferase [Bacteroidia bacterium]|nr:phosphatidate cytidylyltransferase [Bacteroidia bacterium]